MTSTYPTAMDDPMNNLLNLGGRLLIAQIFVLSGVTKLGAWAGTQAWMESMGVSGTLLGPVVALEIGGGLALAAGALTRLTAAALAAFALGAAVLFHADFGDANQVIHFMKNLAMAGGLSMVLAHGAGRYSLDAWWSRRTRAEPTRGTLAAHAA
jgi:putative oxidoreductase